MRTANSFLFRLFQFVSSSIIKYTKFISILVVRRVLILLYILLPMSSLHNTLNYISCKILICDFVIQYRCAESLTGFSTLFPSSRLLKPCWRSKSIQSKWRWRWCSWHHDTIFDFVGNQSLAHVHPAIPVEPPTPTFEIPGDEINYDRVRSLSLLLLSNLSTPLGSLGSMIILLVLF